MSFARDRYRETAAHSTEISHDPHDVVFVTLRELTRALSVLCAAHKQGAPHPAEHLNRALTAIYILQSSLDFEAGGEIAGDLFQLYEFVRFHVLKAWKGEGDARLAEALGAIQDIHEAWDGIRAEAKLTA